MPWVSIQTGSNARGEHFYMLTPVAPSKSYILERATQPNGDRDFWGVWLFGYQVSGVGGVTVKWVERFTKDCYSQRVNYVTAATGDVSAFAFYLPRRSPFPSVEWKLYRFD